MALTGADVEQLRGLGKKLDTDWAGQIDDLISKVDGEISNSQEIWKGPDADEFRNSIWPNHKKSLESARTALQDAGTTAKNNADAQESTSSSVR